MIDPVCLLQAMNYPRSAMSGMPSCTKSVTLRLLDEVIKLKQDRIVAVNGQDVDELPVWIDGIYIRHASSVFVSGNLDSAGIIVIPLDSVILNRLIGFVVLDLIFWNYFHGQFHWIIVNLILLVQLPNGLEVWWDGQSRVYIDSPPTFYDNTQVNLPLLWAAPPSHLTPAHPLHFMIDQP